MGEETFPCGHPRAGPNIWIAFGSQSLCRTCDLARRTVRKDATRQRNAQIVAAYDGGASLDEIADAHSFCRAHVYKILHAADRLNNTALTSDPLFPQRALAVAAECAGANVSQLVSRWRAPKELVHARWCVMAAMRDKGVSLPQIGRRLNRDHSTVLYGIGQAANYAARSPEFADMLQRVRAA